MGVEGTQGRSPEKYLTVAERVEQAKEYFPRFVFWERSGILLISGISRIV